MPSHHPKVKKVPRISLNERMSSIVMPKNPIMVLNELKPGIRFVVVPQRKSNKKKTELFVYEVKVKDKAYIGRGCNRLAAKQQAAEEAIRALLIEKVGAATALAEGGGADSASLLDEVPWGPIASMAVYKLLVDWQKTGVPPKPIAKRLVKHKAMKRIPVGTTTKDPVMLLSQLRPLTRYIEVSRFGTAPHLTITMQTVVEGVTYTGVGPSKRDAKKEAAKTALLAYFDITCQP